MLLNKCKSAFPKLIFCHNIDKNGNTKVSEKRLILNYIILKARRCRNFKFGENAF